MLRVLLLEIIPSFGISAMRSRGLHFCVPQVESRKEARANGFIYKILNA